MKAYQWKKIVEEKNRTLLVGSKIDPKLGLSLMFMVRVGDKAKTHNDIRQALNAFNEEYCSSLIIQAKHIPTHIPFK